MAPQFRLRETCLRSASLSFRTLGGATPVTWPSANRTLTPPPPRPVHILELHERGLAQHLPDLVPKHPPPQPSEGEPAPNLAETGREQKRPGTLAPGRSRKELMSGVPAGVCLAPWAGCVREWGLCGPRGAPPWHRPPEDSWATCG